MPSPFHEGEVSLQERTGERAMALRVGAGIAAGLAPAARAFLSAQRLLVVATLDGRGWPRASLAFGAPGIASSADGRRVALDRSRAMSTAAEIPWSSLGAGAPVGVLAIDLETRRRLRVNGFVASADGSGLRFDVVEAYGNCPKYIRRRRLAADLHGPADLAVTEGTTLDAPRRAANEHADLLFVASHHPQRGADASHRGGPAGFVQVIDDRTLAIPDYPGNGMFNTLGNLSVSDAASLLVPDFERGRILQLAGRARIDLDVPEDPCRPSGGTGRRWVLCLEGWVESPAPRGFRWEHLDASPFNPVPSAEPGGPQE